MLFLALLAALLLLPLTALAVVEDPVADGLKQKAQEAFLAGRYSDAAASNLEIARKHPESEARRYAVQMLGTLYENNLIDVGQAIKWHREFLEDYADPGQVPFYRERLASLEKLKHQEESFAAYQKIRFANKGDEVMVRQFEALLAQHPDFLLKAEVQRELGYAYDRLDKRRESYQAFRSLSSSAGARFSADDRIALKHASHYWESTRVWGGLAWGTVLLLWGGVLLMKPWQRLTRASLRNFGILAALWLLLAGLRMPSFYAINSSTDQYLFPDHAVWVAAALNLPVLFWLQLLTSGKFWQTRPRARLWLGPVLTLFMTAAVFYLFLIYQPNGPKIMDAFAAKYQHWIEERRTPERSLPAPVSEKRVELDRGKTGEQQGRGGK